MGTMTDIEALHHQPEKMSGGQASLHPVQAASGEPPVFSAELFPHRSLGRKGFRVLLAVAALGFLPNTVYFLAEGAWPIAVFCAVTFLGLYGAFRLSYRSARTREYVWLSPHQIRVCKYAPSGRVFEAGFNPLWTRFIVDHHPEFGITGMRLTSSGETVEIGAFLNPEDRESFAKALRSALASVKQRI
ncbi:putative membrane protein [Martelella mediterranea]|uniref:Putative membrane protein n=2 Tax=Martelella mediterranea TaxID=293089 RepID=A0A4R3NYN8_9HYPH|nr:putative membrane protein [Martelella mediterranea]